MRMNLVRFLGLLLLMISIASSGCKKKNQENIQINIDSDSIMLQKKIEEAKQIFYSLPAPHEVASFLMENNESYFDIDLLNKTDNAYKYSSEASLAYNLGVYSADLSYATIFDQNQIEINYMSIAKSLAEQLGILSAFDQSTIDSLQKYITNRDKVMEIISETFMNSDAYLQDNDRQAVGAMMLIGGWIEGMYIASQLTDCQSVQNEKVTSAILDQKITVELIVDFLNNFKEDADLDIVEKDILDLLNLFNTLDTSVNDKGYLTISNGDFAKLCKKIKEIRTKIITLS